MANNLRIISNNLIDLSTTTISASSTASAAVAVTNLISDTKSKVWRTGTTTSANLIISFNQSYSVGGVILPFCNLTTTATIRVRGYTGSAPTHTGTTSSPTLSLTGAITVFDTTATLACPWQAFGVWNWGTNPLGANSYAYGGGTYARVWVPTPTTCQHVTIEIVDASNTSGYLEFSRLIVGNYWTPRFNTSFGLSLEVQDLSKHLRTDAGDLDTVRGPRFNSMKFDLKYMDYADRTKLLEIFKGNGLPRPLFVSLFPNDLDIDREGQFQIYGKLSQLSAIQHPMFTIYSSQIDIQEV